MEQKYTVDARGEQCPIPVVKTKKVLDGIQGDAEITVLVDNETAVQNLTRMGKHAGAEVLLFFCSIHSKIRCRSTF